MKRKYIIVALTMILFISLGLLIANKEKTEQEYKERVIKQKENVEIEYTESDEISDYNYIINPEILSNTKLNIKACSSLNDEVNKRLQEVGIKNEKLKISKPVKKGSVTSFDINCKDENISLHVQYDEKTTELGYLLEVD